jgi:hypothetical protein
MSSSPVHPVEMISTTVKGTRIRLKLKEELCDIITISMTENAIPRESTIPCKGIIIKLISKIV